MDYNSYKRTQIQIFGPGVITPFLEYREKIIL